MQDLLHTHQISSIIALKELIKLNVNTEMIITNVTRLESNTKIMNAALNKQAFKII